MMFNDSRNERCSEPLRRRWMRFTALVAMSLLITACASAPHAEDTQGGIEGGVVEFGCSVDNDCQVKDVGNCCGYFPACVNRDSETFPERVRAQCEKEGRMGVCGFPAINACRCIDNRCVAEQATEDPG